MYDDGVVRFESIQESCTRKKGYQDGVGDGTVEFWDINMYSGECAFLHALDYVGMGKRMESVSQMWMGV